MGNDYKSRNAEPVLQVVEAMLEELESKERPTRGYEISKVYEDLSIFDWWNKYLTKTHLRDMRKFLKEAIKLGYTGYVCFKVGASGCANGMWAHKNESTTGFSPEGEWLYKSFSPDYNYWSFCDGKSRMYPSVEEYDSLKTISALENALAQFREEETI